MQTEQKCPMSLSQITPNFHKSHMSPLTTDITKYVGTKVSNFCLSSAKDLGIQLDIRRTQVAHFSIMYLRSDQIIVGLVAQL